MDEPLVLRPGPAAKVVDATRSEVFRTAMSESRATAQRRRLAAEDRAGYESYPVDPDEFGGLVNAQRVGTRESGEAG